MPTARARLVVEHHGGGFVEEDVRRPPPRRVLRGALLAPATVVTDAIAALSLRSTRPVPVALLALDAARVDVQRARAIRQDRRRDRPR
jgi:hypothetical protein